MNFSLPATMSYTHEQDDRYHAYIFRHDTLGELGRILLHGLPNGQRQISSEVAGDPADPMTAVRMKTFKPVSDAITQALTSPLGVDDTAVMAITPTMAPPLDMVASRIIPCGHCGETAAILIFAEQTTDTAELEDCALNMLPQYGEAQVDTWVIGEMTTPGDDTPVSVLKVWPEREPVAMMSPRDFNQTLDIVLASHCS
ncbi:MAG: hypothetical protein GY814_15520 [Gammaproteobacteria bacterium]|nr:hypothetical protein [Gammaproteobacteria bacterium]